MTLSASSTFIPRFCASLQKDILFVRTKCGTYSKFSFDQSTNRFLTVTCTDCYVVPKETDLFPLYAAWSNRLERYVIFAKNALNGQVEQYVYEKDYEGRTLQTTNDFFTVGGTEKEGVTAIKRNSNGHFRKEQLNWGTKKFEVIPPVPVKMLEIKEAKKEETIPITVQLPVEKIKEMLRNSNKEKGNRSKITLRKRKTDSDGLTKGGKKETKEKPADPMRVVPVQLGAIGNRPKLSNKDIIEIRRLAALMGNPTEPDDGDGSSSDDADYTDSDDNLVVESSC
ncbi:hypothetical protein L5515_002167 [Caenorhabditis briggsae]|uniref:Uncharacterized protein n=1 Tax=Caenorhabditis briggsae TaxID=6238 RepID=A0AAE9E3F2_CAEBR|nr:hypothetical protein L5515_002167 [Caenorhabditis briggsae]